MTTSDPTGSTFEVWERLFTSKAEAERSWTQAEPTPSLERIDALGLAPADPIIDVGGGSSRLVDCLLDRGLLDVTVLDISPTALCQARSRVGNRPEVTWVEADIRSYAPTRQYAVWHDRAVCHFLVDEADVDRYSAMVSTAVRPNGHAIIAAFAPTGPTTCSGLPVRRWSATEFETRFADRFVLERADELEHHTPWDGVQPFTWVVLRRRAS
jgi:trans-aconitate methyltransferase